VRGSDADQIDNSSLTPEKMRSGRALTVAVYLLSGGIVALIAFLIFSPPRVPPAFLPIARLPAFHASINAAVASLLCVGFVAIRTRRVGFHRACMLTCFGLSSLFLVSYVTYHAYAPKAEFGGEGWVRPVYFSLLISHILLAAGILPLALMTLIRALRGDFVRHRSLARWTLPIWLYVAVTGVVVYRMMSPYYGL